MSDISSLVERLAWPVVVLGVLAWNRRAFGRVLDALVQRIEAGAPLKAGGVEVGAAPSLPTVPAESDPRHVDALPHAVYLVHEWKRDRTLDRGELEYYRILLRIESDERSDLVGLVAVTYRLHPTFEAPIRRVTSADNGFELRTAAWGEFNMTAELEFQDGRRIVIERYIDLGRNAA